MAGPLNGLFDQAVHAGIVDGVLGVVGQAGRPQVSLDLQVHDETLSQLPLGRIDAVVYDAPLLNYRVMNEYAGTLTVLESIFDRQDYAFALPQGSDLREPINRAILEYLATDAWRDTLTEYLGQQP